MAKYVWVCLNMPEYARACLIYLNGVCFTHSFLHLFYKPFFTWTHSYLFKRLQETKGYNLNLVFSLAPGSISFAFCFRLTIFTRKIWICYCLLEPRGRVGCWRLWILTYPWSVLIFHSQNLQRNHVKVMPYL